MYAQVMVIDAPSGNHREDDINKALQGVDAQVTGMEFEVLGECSSLLGGGFCCFHTLRKALQVAPIKLDGGDLQYLASGTALK